MSSSDIAPPSYRLPPALRALRPHQWLKNVLVVAAPLAAGRIDAPVLVNTAIAFVAFCLASSTIYLINDAIDVNEDRLHPRKRYRPIAAGQLKISTAIVMAIGVGLVALGVSWLAHPMLTVVIATYLVLQLMYTTFLKHQPVLDLAMVASGFLLRSIAGGVATGIALSQWFLLVAAFGSLFMVAGKRYSESVALGADAGTRKSLREYSSSYLKFVWEMAAAVVVVAYSLWAFERAGDGPWGIPWTPISIIPFALAILRYALEVDRGEAGEPEDVVLKDKPLLILGLIFVSLIAVAVFA